MTISCNNNNSSESKQDLNYANSYNWVSLPLEIDKKVDVFYVYPTIYSGKDPQNMDISDSSLRKNAQGLLAAQAGVYSAHANLFAPYYRQQSRVHHLFYRSYLLLPLPNHQHLLH